MSVQSQPFSLGQIVVPQGPAAAAGPFVAKTFTIEQIIHPRTAAEIAVRIDNVVIVDAEAAPVTA